LTDNQLPDIVVNMMSQFMGQHDLDLVGSVAIQHGIAQHDAPCIAQSHQGGIGSSRLATQFHREDATHAGMGAVGQSEQPLGQVTFGQWSQFIEKRQDQNWSQICHDNCEEEQDECHPEPPELWLCRQQQVYQFNNKGFQHDA